MARNNSSEFKKIAKAFRADEPLGTIKELGFDAPKTGDYLRAGGGSVKKASYPELYSLIGDTLAPQSTHIDVPNFCGGSYVCCEYFSVTGHIYIFSDNRIRRTSDAVNFEHVADMPGAEASRMWEVNGHLIARSSDKTVLFWTTDGVTWTATTVGIEVDGIASDGSVFVAVGTHSNGTRVSSDLMSWQTVGGDGATWPDRYLFDVTYDPDYGRWVFISNNPDVLVANTVGGSATTYTAPFSGTRRRERITYKDGKLYAYTGTQSSSGDIRFDQSSNGGQSWSSDTIGYLRYNNIDTGNWAFGDDYALLCAGPYSSDNKYSIVAVRLSDGRDYRIDEPGNNFEVKDVAAFPDGSITVGVSTEHRIAVSTSGGMTSGWAFISTSGYSAGLIDGYAVGARCKNHNYDYSMYQGVRAHNIKTKHEIVSSFPYDIYNNQDWLPTQFVRGEGGKIVCPGGGYDGSNKRGRTLYADALSGPWQASDRYAYNDRFWSGGYAAGKNGAIGIVNWSYVGVVVLNQDLSGLTTILSPSSYSNGSDFIWMANGQAFMHARQDGSPYRHYLFIFNRDFSADNYRRVTIGENNKVAFVTYVDGEYVIMTEAGVYIGSTVSSAIDRGANPISGDINQMEDPTEAAVFNNSILASANDSTGASGVYLSRDKGRSWTLVAQGLSFKNGVEIDDTGLVLSGEGHVIPPQFDHTVRFRLPELPASGDKRFTYIRGK